MKNLYLARADLSLASFLVPGMVVMAPAAAERSANRFVQEFERALEQYLGWKHQDTVVNIKNDPPKLTPMILLHCRDSSHYFQMYSGNNLDMIIGIKDGKLLDDETDLTLPEAMAHFLEGKDEDCPKPPNLIVEFSERPTYLADIRDSLYGRYDIHVLGLK